MLHGEEAEAAPADLSGARPAAALNKGKTHMVRLLGFLVGLGFVVVAAWSLLWGVDRLSSASRTRRPSSTASTSEPRDVAFSFDGPFGTI